MSAETSPDFLSQPLENPLFNAAGLLNGADIEGLLRDVERLAGQCHRWFNRWFLDTGAAVGAMLFGMVNLLIIMILRLVR